MTLAPSSHVPAPTRPASPLWPHRSPVLSAHLLLVSVLMLASSGCTATRVRASRTTPLERMLELSRPFADRVYRMVPGDSVAVRCYFNPQLDDEQQVRSDGNISLALLGDIKAVGKSPTELSADITKGYAQYFVKPSSVVIVRQFNGHRIFTAGELKQPGGFSLVTTARTVLESISASGGVTPEATLQKVILIRRLPNQAEPMVAKLDIQNALSGKDPAQNVTLMPGDFIYVPRSGLAELNLAMHQWLLNNFNTSTFVGINPPLPQIGGSTPSSTTSGND